MFFSGVGRWAIRQLEREGNHILPARYRTGSPGENVSLSPERGRNQKGSLTLETAMVLPWFLFAMLAMLQFASVQNASSALLAGAQDTAKDMAAYAYIRDLDVAAGDGVAADLITGGISAAYAQGQIRKKSGVSSKEGSLSLLQSCFTEDEMIDLVGTFQPAHTWTLLPVKRQRSIIRARVRAWTGREGSKGGGDPGEGSEQEQEEQVYVAETGQVYHRDPNCTHIKLTIQKVPKTALSGLRNASGGKYHCCERCGKGSGGTVYISPYGDKYHSSLECSGLKRTVRKVSLSEAEGLRPCSKCGREH